jgi:WD40 repeat protein
MEPLLEIGTNHLRACLSGDGQRVAAGFANAIQVWDLPGRAPLRRISVSGEHEPFRFLAQGNKLLSWRRPENSVHEWDLTTGQEARSWPALPGITRGWDVSADERWYFRTASPGPAQLIDLTTGTLTKLDLDLLPNLSDAVLSPDGKYLAACTGGGVKVWETTAQREVAVLRGGIGLVFSGDGKRLAVSGFGKAAVTLWSLESFQELLTLEGGWGFFFSPDFSPDGNLLGAMESLGSLHLWRAPSWEEIEEIEAAEKAGAKELEK